MEEKGKKYLVIYLTDWQKRMVKDFLKKDCNFWKVPIEGSVPKYAVNPEPETHVKKMYLTDWQSREIRAEAGVSCDYVELKDEGTIPLYGVFPDKG